MTSKDILVGADVEYGLWIEGRGAAQQIFDSSNLVKLYPGRAWIGWDYRHESSRADLRGFVADRLNIDPEDAKFDADARNTSAPTTDERADRILPNGARLYSDHGHPEYASPECRSIFELARQDWAGVLAVGRAAQQLEQSLGRTVKIYRNNTDFHGASYGSHENYLLPRSLTPDQLLRGLLPMLVCRQILSGAGKVGSDRGSKIKFQLSQRADFFSELQSVDTLYRRPIFNTRDEPHGLHQAWQRLHVISGDVNMRQSITALKFGLLKLACRLVAAGVGPALQLSDPIETIQRVSEDLTFKAKHSLVGRGELTAVEILRAYLSAFEKLELDEEDRWVLAHSDDLLNAIERGDRDFLSQHLDWAAKLAILEQAGGDQAEQQAYDLAYTDCDPEEGLFYAWQTMTDGAPNDSEEVQNQTLEVPPVDTRAWVRGNAIRYPELKNACWRTLTFEDKVIDLAPNLVYPRELGNNLSVQDFITLINSHE